MADMLSRDLEEEDFSELDIFGEEEPETDGTLDIMVDEEETEDADVTEEVTETTEEVTEEVTETTEDTTSETDESNLEDILSEGEDVNTELNNATEKTEEIKESVEEVREAIDSDNTEEASKLIDELYTEVFNYAAEIDTINTKNQLLQSKLKDLSSANADLELQVASTSGMSNDPKMVVLNRMYSDATEGKDFAKEKVVQTLEDMYYSLTGNTFEGNRVDRVSDDNSEGIVLNDNTTPEVVSEIEDEEEDFTSTNSIF